MTRRFEPRDYEYSIPLRAISWKTERLIVSNLNVPCYKFIHGQQPTFADIRGIVSALGYEKLREKFDNEPSPAFAMLQQWKRDLKNKLKPSIGSLFELLLRLERYDILYDIEDSIRADTDEWRRTQEDIRNYEMRLQADDLIVKENEFSTPKEVDFDLPTDILKFDDGTPLFDAIFSYDRSSPYTCGVMQEIFDVLSSRPFCLKLCDGELKSGTHETMAYISLVLKRCRRVIVLITKQYLLSEFTQYQLLFAKMQDPMAMKRKMIPVLVEKVKLPPILIDIVPVKYFQVNERQYCYQMLYKALKEKDEKNIGL